MPVTRHFRASLLALASVAPFVAPAEAAGVRSWDHGDYGRMVFDWNAPVGYRVDVTPTRITVDFDRPVSASLAGAIKLLDAYLADAKISGDGTDVVLTPRRPVMVQDMALDKRVVLDFRFAPEGEGSEASAEPAAASEDLPSDDRRSAALPAAEASARATASTAPVEDPAPAEPRAAAGAASVPKAVPKALPPAAVAPAVEAAPGRQTAEQPVGLPRRLIVPPAEPGRAMDSAPPGAETPAAAADQAAPPTVDPLPATAEVPSVAQDQKSAVEPPEPDIATTASPDAAETPAVPAEPRAVFQPGADALAAVFERSGHLWIAFASKSRLSSAALLDQAEALGPAELIEAEGGIALRVPMPVNRSPVVTREGTRWTVTLSPAASRPGRPPTITPQPEFPLGSRLLIEATGARGLVRVVDPEVGDVLIVAPMPDAGMGLPDERRFAQVVLLPSAQGVVAQPIADNITVRIDREGVEITAEDGLLLSPPADRQARADLPVLDNGKRYLQIEEWQVPSDDYVRSRQDHLRRIAETPDRERSRPRLELARLYVAHGFGAEAVGLLNIVATDVPTLVGRPDFMMLRGAARVLAGDLEGAQADLSIPDLSDSPEATLWRGAAAARAGEWDAAAKAFNQTGPLLDTMPEPFTRYLILPAALAAVENGDLKAANHRLGLLDDATGGAAAKWPAVVYLDGRIDEATGDRAGAVAAYEQVVASNDRLYQTRAEMALIALKLADGEMTPEAAAARLEGLSYGWRGDGVEQALLVQLGDAYWKGGRYRDALDAWNRAIELYPDHPAKEGLERMRVGRLAELFATDALDMMSPIAAASLYEDYKALMPTGDAGDRVVRRLAERLVEIDLLDRAGDMLERLVADRLQGVDKPEAGARLAGIRLLDGKPTEALAALEASEATGDLGADLEFERLLLRARSLSELGRADEALALLAGDDRDLALAATLDIAWRAQDWQAAAAALDGLIDPPPVPGVPIAQDQAQLVLNRGIALSLAKDRAGLDRLAATFGPAMDASPHANTFAVLTRSNAPVGALTDLATIRREVAEVDLFQNFLAGYRTAGSSPALMN